MCGLFGFQFTNEQRPLPVELGILTFNLGEAAQSRGRHSYGYAGYEDGEITIAKEDEEFTRTTLVAETALYGTVIGHTRFATVGARTATNAHPFQYMHIVGAHNGGIRNYPELNAKYERNFDVDSQHLIAHIAEEKEFGELKGYGAVTWYDTREPGVVYLCRMRQGELEVERMPGGGIIWASTKTILSSAMSPLRWYSKSKAMTLDEAVVYRVENGHIEATDARIKLEDPPAYVSSHHSAPWQQRQQNWGENGFGWWEETGPGCRVWHPGARPASPATTTTTSDTSKRKRRKVVAAIPPTKSAYETQVDEYNQALDGYLAGVEYLQGTRRVDPRIDGLYEALATRFQFTDKEEEIALHYIDTMSRRSRRRHEKWALATACHKIDCRCTPCKKVETLLDGFLTVLDEEDGLLQ